MMKIDIVNFLRKIQNSKKKQYTLAMNKWITTGIVTELLPINRDFKKLTWVPRPFDGVLPAPSAEARRQQIYPSETQDR